jgi:uncharacterized membrane protein
MIPKSRLDALTDGVFAAAMTLLVIDLRRRTSIQRMRRNGYIASPPTTDCRR